jgi:hypothetical protein
MAFDEGLEGLRRPSACPRDQCCVIHARQETPELTLEDVVRTTPEGTPDDPSTCDGRG